MRIHRILLVVLALGCASPPPPGAGLPRLKFSELDTNEDGTIDAEEFKTFSDAIFQHLDTDGDGKISEAEYKQFAEQHRPPHRRHHGGGPRPGGGMDGGFPGGGGGPY